MLKKFRFILMLVLMMTISFFMLSVAYGEWTPGGQGGV